MNAWSHWCLSVTDICWWLAAWRGYCNSFAFIAKLYLSEMRVKGSMKNVDVYDNKKLCLVLLSLIWHHCHSNAHFSRTQRKTCIGVLGCRLFHLFTVIVNNRQVNRRKWQVGREDQREEKIRVKERTYRVRRLTWKNNISVPPTSTTASSLPFLHVIKPIVTFN